MMNDNTVRDLLARYRVAHTALHMLWSRAVGTPSYVKADWMLLDNEIVRVFRDEAERLGYKGPLLP